MKPRVVITRSFPQVDLSELADYAEVWVSPLDRPLTRTELLEHVRGASAIICVLNDRIDGEVVDAAGTSLQIVATVSAGVDHIDTLEMEQRGVVVTNTPGVLTNATADLAMGLILASTRRIVEGDHHIRSGASWEWDLRFMLGSSLQGAIVGIVGLGEIGRAVATRAQAFGMSVLATRGGNRPHQAPVDGVTLASLTELLEQADVLTLHCPLTPETHHLIDHDQLNLMKDSAYLINTSRGPIIDESALVKALQSQRIAGAALDVFEYEPKVSRELLAMPNVVLTPHLGSATLSTRMAMYQTAVENVTQVLAGSASP